MSCEVPGHLEKRLGEIVQKVSSRKDAIKILRDEVFESARHEMLQVKAYEKLELDLKSYEDGSDTIKAGAYLFFNDPTRKAKYNSIELEQNIIANEANLKLSTLLNEQKSTIFGNVRDVEFSRKLAKEMAGESTGDAGAKAMAKAVQEVQTGLVNRFNKAGGDIKRIDNYGVRTTHNPSLILDSGFDAWKKDITSELDLAQMKVNHPLIDMDDALKGIYNSITGNTAGKKIGKYNQDLVDRHQSKRFFIFKNEEAQFNYLEKYGDHKGDTVGTILEDIQGLSNEIAIMERLGVDPAATLARAEEAGIMDLQSGKGLGGLATQEMVWKDVSGVTAQSQNLKFAKGMAAARSTVTASSLGGATISNLPDIAFGMAAAWRAGIPVMRNLTDRFKKMKPEEAADYLYISEVASTRSSSASRWTGEAMDINHNWASKGAEGVLRGTGLSAITEGGRKAMKVGMARGFGGSAHKSWGQLNKRNRKTFNDFNISEMDWEFVRKNALEKDSHGNPYIVASQITDEAIQNNWHRMVQAITDIATPIPDARIRAIMNRGTKRGQFDGEIGKTMGQFKGFLLSVIAKQGAIGIQKGNRMNYAATVAGTTGMGYVVLNLKNIVAGKEWIDIEGLDMEQTIKLVFMSYAMGGSGGMMGDWAAGAAQADGFNQKNFFKDLAGPIPGKVYDIFDLIGTNIHDALTKPEPTNFIAEFLKRAYQEVPGNNVFYWNLAFKRQFENYILKEIDEKFYQRLRRTLKKTKDHFGQEHWWTPGESLPKFLQ